MELDVAFEIEKQGNKKENIYASNCYDVPSEVFCGSRGLY